MEFASEYLSMALLDFQTALGRLVRVQNGKGPLDGLHLDTRDSLYLEGLQETAGFLFCRSIQRSWCVGRAAKSAHLTLSFLPDHERQTLLDEWIDSGAGTRSFYDSEAGSFLEFISHRLANPSHQLSVCQLEQATLRAGEGMNSVIAADAARLSDDDCMLRRGRYAGLVEFYGDPHLVLESLQKHEPLPPLSSEITILLFGPGVEQLCYVPSAGQVALWHQLETAQSVRTLLSQPHERNTLAKLQSYGIIEYAD